MLEFTASMCYKSSTGKQRLEAGREGGVHSYWATKMKADIILVWYLDTRSQLQVLEKPKVV